MRINLGEFSWRGRPALKKLHNNQRFTAVTVAAGVAVIGGTFLLVSHAATPSMALEPENGTLSGGVAVVADASASSGKAVKFGAGAGSTLSINDSTTGTGLNQFNFSSGWNVDTTKAPLEYKADDHWTSDAAAYYTVQFSGTQIKVYTQKTPGAGIVAISIDGGSETQVDDYAPSNQDQVLMYTSPVLVDGTHTLKVRNTGQTGQTSGGTDFVADRVDVLVPGSGSGGTPTPTSTPTPTQSGNPMPVGVPGNWTLKFDDEFNGTSLDRSRWSDRDGGNMNSVTTRASNISVSGGNLILTLSDGSDGAEVDSAPYDGAGANGYVMPVGAYAEARIWFPGDGSGCYNWPAWWESGPNWPAAGEHDIAEVLSGEMTVNYHSPSGSHNQNGVPGYWCGGFHTYGLYRKSSSADVYYDGKLVKSYSTDDDGQPGALLINVGTSDSPTVYGAASQVKVDYVRAWQ